MKYWAYLNDDVSQKPYSEDELRQLPGFGPDLLVCSETSAVSAEPDWRPVKDLLPHLIRPKAPNFAKFRPKPPVPMANTSTPEQSFQQPQQQMPQSMPMTQDTLPIPNVLPAGISAMPMPQYGQVNMQMPVQNQPQQTFAQNDLSMALLAQLESLNSKINSLENKIVEQEKELAEAYNKPEDDYNPPTLISEPQNEQEDDVLEVPFEDDFVSSVGKSSEEIAKEAEDILSNPTSAEIEEYNTDDQKTELMTFGSDIQNILENTIRQDLKEAELKKMKQLEENQEKPIIAEDLISRTMLSFPANGSKPQVTQQEEDIQETTSSDELNIDDLDALLEQQNQSSEDEKEEILEEQPAQEEVAEEKAAEETPVEETPAEDVTEQKEEVVEEQPAQEEVAEEKAAEETPVEETPVVEQPLEDVVEEQSTEETPTVEQPLEDPYQINEDLIDQQEVKEEITEEDQHVVSLSDADDLKIKDPTENYSEQIEPQDVFSDLQQNVTEDIIEETPAEEQPAKDIIEQKEEVVAETPVEGEQPKEEGINDEDPLTSGVSISKDDTTAAVLDEIAHEKSNDIVPETTPDQLFEEFENTVQENEAEKENLNVDAIIEETKNQPMPQVNENAPVNEDNEKLEEMPKDLPKEDEFLKTFTMSVEEVFLDQPTAIISDYVPPSDNTQRNIQNLADTSTGLTMATIRREKPSDIKTVPLVSGAMGQEIWSSPYVESATAQLRKKTKFHDTLKFGIIVGAAILIIVIVYTFFAVMGIVPEKLSPLHRIVYSLQKSPEEKVSKGEEMAPEVIEDTNIAAVPNEPEVPPQVEHQAPVQAPASKPAEPEMTGEELVIQSVKSYAFKDGTTLEQRILAAHPNLGGNMDWSLYPTEEEDVFSIAIKLPPNNAGQSFSYRFNYNIISEQLTPTTSEAKNIMKK